VLVKKARPPQRFRDDGRSLFDGLDDIRVKCPKCGGAGLGVRRGAALSLMGPANSVCYGCRNKLGRQCC